MGHTLTFENSNQNDLNFFYFFQNSKYPLFILKKNGIILKANSAANKYNLKENTDLFAFVIELEAQQAKEKLKKLENEEPLSLSVKIDFSSFPNFLLQTSWKVILLDAEHFAFSCEELHQYSPEDFLLHKGLMRIIFDSDPNLIGIVNRIGHYLFVNKALYDFAGKNNENNIEKLNKLIEEGEISLPGNDLHDKEIVQNPISEVELTTDHSGNPIWFENTKVPIQLPFGEQVQLIISKNLTKWKVTEKKLEDIHEVLDYYRKISYLGEILAKTAVDLRNPLTLILNFMNNVRQNKNEINTLELDTVQISLQTIDSFIEKIEKSFRVMRSIAKNNVSVRVENIKISDLISNTLNVLIDKLKAFDIKLNINYSGLEEQEISCQPINFNIAFRFLFLNSIDSIIISQTNENRLIEINISKKEKRISIDLSNNGAQILEEYKNKIFEPFFTTKPTGKGSGLSLNIAKNIIEQMNGTITFQSNEKKTTFTIELPCL
ncbi:sensor histidine kinase [Fluviispira vulneris]|uniref:sensor histidine kinase n=1 Tax=Fluviispira vulneris TaxID=2763012 RepID=UPI0016495474|nr:HAMP domain-containing sensor histidine kinase [Fluviispira vulneris]